VPQLKDRIDKFLTNVFDVIDVVGKKILGGWWETVYLSIQDALAMGLLIQVPDKLGHLITGKTFNSLDACAQEGSWGNVNRYVCFVMVSSNFILWFILAARIIIRNILDFKKLRHLGSNNNA
jgi:hypothetical protein